MDNIMFYVTMAIMGITAVTVFFGCFYTVNQQTRRIVERFGEYVKVAHPGLNLKLPFIDSVSDPISLRVESCPIEEIAYTDKGTSVTIGGSVMYMVDENDESVKRAYYKLANPIAQIKSHVSTSVRAKVPTMSLEKVVSNQTEISSHVKDELTETMSQYGYVITDVPFTRVDPDPSVVKANNAKYASLQEKETAVNLAAANYTRVVQAAEAEAEAMKIHGTGITNERSEIFKGLQIQVKGFEESVPGTTAADAMTLVAFQQYIDMMTKFSQSNNGKVIFMPSGASAATDLMSQIRNAIISGAEATTMETASEPVKQS